MFLSGVKLLILGMLFVFLFLILLYAIMFVFAVFFKNYSLLEEQSLLTKNNKNNKIIPVAAILGAISYYRNIKK